MSGKVVKGGDAHALSVVEQVTRDLEQQGLAVGQAPMDGPGMLRVRRNVQFPPAPKPVNADVKVEYDSKVIQDGKHRIRTQEMTEESRTKLPHADDIMDPITGKPRQHVRYVSTRDNIIVRS